MDLGAFAGRGGEFARAFVQTNQVPASQQSCPLQAEVTPGTQGVPLGFNEKLAISRGWFETA